MFNCEYRFSIEFDEQTFFLRRKAVFPFVPQVGMRVEIGCGSSPILYFCVNLDGSLWISLGEWKRLSEEDAFEDIRKLRSNGWEADLRCFDELTSVDDNECYEGYFVIGCPYIGKKFLVEDFQRKCLNVAGVYNDPLGKIEKGELVNA